jgi:CheY-like chemotaxis protein
VGKGSVFHFTLPYDPIKADNTSGTEKKNAQEPVQTKKTILVVEDDENSCKYLLFLLSRMNLRPVHASNGADAINALKLNPEISLVLMDLKMPGMDGLQTTSEIRKFNKTIPIIAQSAYALPGKKEMAIEAGCNGYITKPIKREDLARIINKILQNVLPQER